MTFPENLVSPPSIFNKEDKKDIKSCLKRRKSADNTEENPT